MTDHEQLAERLVNEAFDIENAYRGWEQTAALLKEAAAAIRARSQNDG